MSAVTVIGTGYRDWETYGIFIMPCSSSEFCLPTEDAIRGCQCTPKQISQILVSRLSSATAGALCAGAKWTCLYRQHFNLLNAFLELGP